jgi:hypothetical protein
MSCQARHFDCTTTTNYCQQVVEYVSCVMSLYEYASDKYNQCSKVEDNINMCDYYNVHCSLSGNIVRVNCEYNNDMIMPSLNNSNQVLFLIVVIIGLMILLQCICCYAFRKKNIGNTELRRPLV